MMYNNKLAVAIKHKGKVLREFGETVYLPFGSEYSILIKNLNTVKALVKVEIDGTDVGDGSKFILEPNSDLNLERFIKNGNLEEGNRFKFIERSENVEKHRGVGLEDGLVRVEFQFEKKEYNLFWNNTPSWWNNTPTTYGTDATGLNKLRNFSSSKAYYSANISNTEVTSNVSNTTQNDIGITVPGSISDQKFKEGSYFPVELETHVIVLKLLGETEDNKAIKKAVTVKAKPKCITCGRTNKATAKFCSECGTALTIV